MCLQSTVKSHNQDLWTIEYCAKFALFCLVSWLSQHEFLGYITFCETASRVICVCSVFQGDVKDDLFDIIEEKFNVDPDFIHDIGTVKR